MRTNEGYTITHSCVIHLNREVVLDNYKEALADFGERITNEANITL